MTETESTVPEQPSLAPIYTFARLVTVAGTLMFLALIGIYRVVDAWTHDFYVGVRSLAGALFPMVIGSYLYLFNRDVLQRVGGARNGLGFAAGLSVGILVMVVLQLFARTTLIPIPEVVVAGCFSSLVFAAASTPEHRALSWFYGVMTGLLAYIIFLGFPHLK